MNNQFSVARPRAVENINCYSESVKGPWKSGTSSAPSFVSFVSFKEKQATNSCDCEPTLLELRTWSRTTNATAHSVNGRQESKDAMLRTVWTLYPATKCTLERRPFTLDAPIVTPLKFSDSRPRA